MTVAHAPHTSPRARSSTASASRASRSCIRPYLSDQSFLPHTSAPSIFPHIPDVFAVSTLFRIPLSRTAPGLSSAVPIFLRYSHFQCRSATELSRYMRTCPPPPYWRPWALLRPPRPPRARTSTAHSDNLHPASSLISLSAYYRISQPHRRQHRPVTCHPFCSHRRDAIRASLTMLSCMCLCLSLRGSWCVCLCVCAPLPL